jgi:hypothetical protein
MIYSSFDLAAFFIPDFEDFSNASVSLSSDDFRYQSFFVGSIGKISANSLRTLVLPFFFQNFNVTPSEYPSCSKHVANTSNRRLSSVPTITSVDDGEAVSFVLSTSSLPSNYRQLKGTDLSGVTSVKLLPLNVVLTLISITSSSLFVQFPLGVGMDYFVSVFVGSVEYSASQSLSSTFGYQRNL